jgi:hypothetical protein
MTDDELIKIFPKNKYGIYAFTATDLINFINLMQKIEREKCIDMADSLGWINVDSIRARNK